MIRVLVVDDSATARGAIVDALEEEPGLEVVGQARDGAGAVQLVHELRPDVVTLDMSMPRVDGLDATARIMAERPTPILIVSASINRREAFATFDALSAGAVDVYDKTNGLPTDEWRAELRARVRMVARIAVVRHIAPRAPRTAPAARAPADSRPRSEPAAAAPVALGVGASTGGPAAVARLLHDVGAPPVAVLVVIHVGELFAAALAEWLSSMVPRGVRPAEDGTRLRDLQTGPIALAPAGCHMVVESGRVRLVDRPPRHHCRPSVDELFESFAEELKERGAGALLTGMGRDGARGLLSLRAAGGMTFAQDEESSVVFGMPGEAVRLGAARHVLPIDRMGSVVRSWAERAAPGWGA